MQRLKENKKGFTLIEVIIALGILAIIAVILMPSLNTILTTSTKGKEASQVIYALESAIEKEKIKDEDRAYGVRTETINGIDVTIYRSKFEDNLDKIRVESGNFELTLIEVVNEKTWFYSN